LNPHSWSNYWQRERIATTKDPDSTAKLAQYRKDFSIIATTCIPILQILIAMLCFLYPDAIR
jgi:hypothetical protein